MLIEAPTGASSNDGLDSFGVYDVSCKLKPTQSCLYLWFSMLSIPKYLHYQYMSISTKTVRHFFWYECRKEETESFKYQRRTTIAKSPATFALEGLDWSSSPASVAKSGQLTCYTGHESSIIHVCGLTLNVVIVGGLQPSWSSWRLKLKSNFDSSPFVCGIGRSGRRFCPTHHMYMAYGRSL